MDRSHTDLRANSHLSLTSYIHLFKPSLNFICDAGMTPSSSGCKKEMRVTYIKLLAGTWCAVMAQ